MAEASSARELKRPYWPYNCSNSNEPELGCYSSWCTPKSAYSVELELLNDIESVFLVMIEGSREQNALESFEDLFSFFSFASELIS